MTTTISKASLLTFFSVCCLVLSICSTSYADVTCTVKVESVYMTTPDSLNTHTGAMVKLKNTTSAAIGTWAKDAIRSFYIAKVLGNQGMAVALTALSNKTKVDVNIAGTATGGSLIKYIGVTQVAQ